MTFNKKEYQKEYYLKNKEYLKEHRKKYYLKNKENDKKYRLKNKEHIKEYRDKYYRLPGNKERKKEWNRKYNLKNIEYKKEWSRQYNLKEKTKEHIKEYRLKNKEHIKKLKKKYSSENREHTNQRTKERRRVDLNFKLTSNLRNRMTKVLKGINKSASTMELIGCTIDELWIHMESKFTDGMTRENHGKWHVDHIKACAKFDLTNPKQQQICFNYTNLQPLWALDNIRKGNE